jgi:hypothetical protein
MEDMCKMWQWHIIRHFHRILLERLRLEKAPCRKTDLQAKILVPELSEYN